MKSPFDTITLRDVARAAGVSTASASRGLAGESNVSAELRSRVLAAARRLGYVPNLAARTLATRRSGLFGMVVGNVADPLMAGIFSPGGGGPGESPSRAWFPPAGVPGRNPPAGPGPRGPGGR